MYLADNARKGYQGDLSPDAFGVTVCLFAYSNLCFGTNAAFPEIRADPFARRAPPAESDRAASILASYTPSER